MPDLTAKQRAWVAHYFLCSFDAVIAAERAGYAEPEVAGPANLRKPHLQAALDAYMEQHLVTAAEVLWRLSVQARANYGDYIAWDAAGQPRWDLAKATAKDGLLALKKLKISENAKGYQMDIELHDAQAALKQLGAHYQLFSTQPTPLADQAAAVDAARERVLAKIEGMLAAAAATS